MNTPQQTVQEIYEEGRKKISDLRNGMREKVKDMLKKEDEAAISKIRNDLSL
ncbi:hypothetical protein HOI18_00050 [Candidatus Uhrbacteria bacterium]|nr:hypothetical protein [Candidatus Uhrbacteria bacterium]